MLDLRLNKKILSKKGFSFFLFVLKYHREKLVKANVYNINCLLANFSTYLVERKKRTKSIGLLIERRYFLLIQRKISIN